jgi:hypothetical protein
MKSGEDYREPILLSGAEQEKFIAELLRGDVDDGYRDWPEELRDGEGKLGNPLLTRGFIRELRDLMGDRRTKYRISDIQGKPKARSPSALGTAAQS